MLIPRSLADTCRTAPERVAWLERLPDVLSALAARWSLEVGEPFDGDEVSCGWVAPATRADGTTAVLKLGMPHYEGEHEIAGLRFWDGDGVARLLDADEDLNAMLLERLEPGTPLRALAELEQDVEIAGLLRRLWRPLPPASPIRPLSAMLGRWTRETLAASDRWDDAGLVREGLALFEELPRTAAVDVVLATDLHAGNVLAAAREPWLAIDPKPFHGDPAYDATQHLLNCRARLGADPAGTIGRIAGLLGLEPGRIRLWTFARVAAESRTTWGPESTELARALRP